MSTTTTPVYTAGTTVHASASLAASATANNDVDFSGVFEAQLNVLNTPAGSVAATRGLRVDIYRRYGAGPTTAPTPFLTYFLPSQTASTAESLAIFLTTGKYNVKITNLDATNAVTVEILADTVASLSTT